MSDVSIKNIEEQINWVTNLKYKTFKRYTCNKFENYKGGILLMWNTSVSDHCCQNCDGVIYKADSVIDTIHHEDECQTRETSVCRILPGMRASYFNLYQFPCLKEIKKPKGRLNFHIKIAVMMKQVRKYVWLKKGLIKNTSKVYPA